MKWFLVRFKHKSKEAHRGEVAYALRTREQAIRLRDLSGSKLQTVEVIPAFKIREIMKEWDKMIKDNEFARNIGDRPALTIGEVAVLQSCKQDLLERLASL